jgi:CBS domain-containing protein
MLGFREVLRYTAGRADWAANGLPTEGSVTQGPRVATLARTDVLLCRPDERLGDVQRRARQSGAEFAVVVSPARVVLGTLDRDALDWYPDRLVEEVMRPGPPTLRPNTALPDAKEYLWQIRRNRVLVTTSDGKLIGLLEGSDIERAAA